MIAWWDVPENVRRLGDWLNERGEFFTTEDVLAFYDKPWNWQEEWDEMSDLAVIDDDVEGYR